MKLYRIQRKSDKQFFAGFSPHYVHTFKRTVHRSEGKFSETGVLYRQLKPLEKALQWLCSDEHWEDVHTNTYRGSSRRTIAYNLYTPKWDAKRLKQYDIVITDVTVNGHTKIAAHKLFGDSK